MHLAANLGSTNGPLSSALARTFRGKLCDVILRNRSVTTFEKGQLIYDAGDPRLRAKEAPAERKAFTAAC
jgi:hypothetical protein